ncbi:MAG: dihydropteroate synthase [Anaerolineae bacterium]
MSDDMRERSHSERGDVSPPFRRSLRLRGLQLEWGSRTYVMAIVNVTPDSFSGDGVVPGVPGTPESGVPSGAARGAGGGGAHGQVLGRDAATAATVAAATEVAAAAVADGAHIIDVGGESTRPGAASVAADEEIERVVPVIRALRSRFDLPISIDTYKAPVAEAALDAGADMVNDVWGLRGDPDMAALVARRDVPVVVMHNRSDPSNLAVVANVGGHYVGVRYDDVIGDVRAELQASVDMALAAGIPPEHIVVDPGIGFGKTLEQNLELLDRVGEIRDLGYPVLIGPSRKSFIGLTLDTLPDDRLEGTAAAAAVAITRGADMVRVHDVKAMTRVARMTDAIVRR